MRQGPFAAQEGSEGVAQNSSETLINMYAHIDISGKSQLVRHQRPGLTLAHAQSGVKRGIEEFVHGHYAVIRDIFYKFNGTALTPLGTLGTNIGNVTMITDDNNNVAISDGVTLYHYAASTGLFTLPTTPTTVGTLAILDGFGIYNEPNSGTFYISALNDLTDWDALDFATAEDHPDPIIRVFTSHNEIWFFGTETIEVWRNIGAQTFPFAPNTTIERGCAAAYSVASEDNTLFWLGDDHIVYRADGYRPARISTDAIDHWIADAPDASTGKAFIYTHHGHKFYVLTFPDYGTRQYNVATGFWNACQSFGEEDWEITGGAGKNVTYYLTPAGFVTLDESKNTDAGAIMERGGTSAPVWSDGELMTLSTFWLNCEVGKVAVTASEPQVTLQVSTDGEMFGNHKARGLGLTGNYIRRVVWRNLGQARQFVLKLSCTDDVSFTIMSTHGDIA